VYGHNVGDQVLAEVAVRLSDAAGHTNIAGRLGGDEFVVIVPNPAGPEAVATVAGSLAKTLRASRVACQDVELPITASVGAVCEPASTCDAQQLLDQADQRMYAHKRSAVAYQDGQDPRGTGAREVETGRSSLLPDILPRGRAIPKRLRSIDRRGLFTSLILGPTAMIAASVLIFRGEVPSQGPTPSWYPTWFLGPPSALGLPPVNYFDRPAVPNSAANTSNLVMLPDGNAPAHIYHTPIAAIPGLGPQTVTRNLPAADVNGYVHNSRQMTVFGSGSSSTFYSNPVSGFGGASTPTPVAGSMP
jgi:GGDEF domain-containing protein